MAGGQERILRGRIRSVQATKKITRAMELIAASRIVKAQQRVTAAQPYSDQITEVVKDLAAAGTSSSPLLVGREVKTTAYVVITADRGLCGGYNAGVQRATEGEIKKDVLKGSDYAVIAVGRKAEGYFRFRGYRIAKSFAGFSDNPTYADARAIGQWIVAEYEAGNIDRVELVYTRFISAGSQEVVQRPLVPLDRDTVEGGDGKGTDADGTVQLDVGVSPTLLPREHPLAGVHGVNNAILVEGDPVGRVMFYGPGAGAGRRGRGASSSTTTAGAGSGAARRDPGPAQERQACTTSPAGGQPTRRVSSA